jgi:hypothetical protein
MGPFEIAGKAMDESIGMAAAVREGRLTRSQFDAWYSRRTAEGAGLVGSLRQSTMRLLEPIGSVLDQGRRALSPMAAPRHVHRRHARARPASHRK